MAAASRHAIAYNSEVVPSSDRLNRLYAATTALSEPSLTEYALHERIVGEAARLLHARYAALGLLGAGGSLERFVTTGLTPTWGKNILNLVRVLGRGREAG